MFSSETQIRVRYGETDQMGYCYYGNYAQYFEVGRVEALRALGQSYRALEENGIMLPVADFSVKYKKPAYYDDLLTIRTVIEEMPTVRFPFRYETYNEKGDLLNTATTTLVFVAKETGRPVAPPEEMLTALRPYFE